MDAYDYEEMKKDEKLGELVEKNYSRLTEDEKQLFDQRKPFLFLTTLVRQLAIRLSFSIVVLSFLIFYYRYPSYLIFPAYLFDTSYFWKSGTLEIHITVLAILFWGLDRKYRSRKIDVMERMIFSRKHQLLEDHDKVGFVINRNYTNDVHTALVKEFNLLLVKTSPRERELLRSKRLELLFKSLYQWLLVLFKILFLGLVIYALVCVYIVRKEWHDVEGGAFITIFNRFLPFPLLMAFWMTYVISSDTYLTNKREALREILIRNAMYSQKDLELSNLLRSTSKVKE